MKTHYYKNIANSDVNFSSPKESALFAALPDESLMNEDIICTLYELKRNSKPADFPSMTRVAIIQHIKLLNDKKFLKSYQPHELRNSLKLGR